MTYFVVLCLLCGGATALINGLYFSFLICIGAVGLGLLWELSRGNVRPIAIVIAFLGFWAVQAAVSQASSNTYFVPHSVKILILIITAFVIGPFMNWPALHRIAKIAPVLYVLQAIVVFFGGMGYYYGASLRFGNPMFGSPNTNAFIGALLFALNLYMLSRAWRAGNGIQILWFTILALAILTIIISTESDGGILLTAVAIAVFFRRYINGMMLFLLGLCLIAVIGWFDFNTNYPELIGSGRLIIWLDLIMQWLTSPRNILIGVGPGGIDLEPGFTAKVISAHSIYIEALFTFGLIGLGLLLIYLISAARSICRAASRLPADEGNVLLAIYIMVIVGMAIDSYFLAAQLVWLGAFVHGIVCLARRTTISQRIA